MRVDINGIKSENYRPACKNARNSRLNATSTAHWRVLTSRCQKCALPPGFCNFVNGLASGFVEDIGQCDHCSFPGE